MTILNLNIDISHLQVWHSASYRMPMVYFKENYNFSRFQRGSNIFSRGVQLFLGGGGGGGGVQLLIPYRNPYNLCFFWGVLAPCPPPHPTPWISACNSWINWMLWQKLYMRKSCEFWTSLGIPICIHGVWENNHRVRPGSKLFFISEIFRFWQFRVKSIVFYLLH